jgi:dolichol-phosphate mannosyltransferase
VEQSNITICDQKAVIQLFITIPIFNPETIRLFIIEMDRILASFALTYEIIFRNDRSSDNTLEILQNEIADSLAYFQVISYPENRGKGYAVGHGDQKSCGNTVLFLYWDLDIHPYLMTDYLTELTYYNIVIGSKAHPLSKVNAPLSRKFLSRIFNLFVRNMTSIEIKDTQSGLKAGNGITHNGNPLNQ